MKTEDINFEVVKEYILLPDEDGFTKNPSTKFIWEEFTNLLVKTVEDTLMLFLQKESVLYSVDINPG